MKRNKLQPWLMGRETLLPSRILSVPHWAATHGSLCVLGYREGCSALNLAPRNIVNLEKFYIVPVQLMTPKSALLAALDVG